MKRAATLEEARVLDARDPLGRFRERFYQPAGQIYLDGNSLGLLSREAEESLLRVIDEWKTGAIAGWTEGFAPWFTMSESLGARVARLIGAEPDEVAIGNSTSVNLHQLLATLYRPNHERSKLLIDALSFPSDRYALRSHLRLRGLDPSTHLIEIPAEADGFLDEARIEKALADPTIQIAVVPTVVYITGQLLDVRRLCAAARERGVLIGLDISHSIGVMPHALDEWGADFAVWGHYKYISAGPGAVAGLYLNRRHFADDGTVEAGLAGWWSGSKEEMFEMADRFSPGQGAAGLQIGTPPILSMAPLEGALSVIEEAGIEAVRAKSVALTDFLRNAIERELPGAGFAFATPIPASHRGGHLSVRHEDAGGISQALRTAGVIADFRKPDILRLAPAPLYVSFADCWEAVRILKEIVAAGAPKLASADASLVT
jgi:kynureninase